jgi:uncharacterized protein YdeI (YjbR/CyaY-like superfamily)
MARSAVKSFSARLEPDGTSLHWVIARLPFDIDKAWPERRRMRVRGQINGFPFRTSLFRAPGGSGHRLLVNKTMQRGAGARLGDMVKLRLEPDLEERGVVLCPELERALRCARQLRPWFDRLSPSTRRAVGALVLAVKSAESRRQKAEGVAEWLLSAMEGERQLPPILRAAFAREPLAEAGWRAMTSVQRRGHLLGIFSCRGPEARQRRAGKAVQEAVQAAKRSLSRPQ